VQNQTTTKSAGDCTMSIRTHLRKKKMDFIELVKSFKFVHGLITYPDGRSRLMDIDGITQKLGFFIIIESKTFYLDEIEIKDAPYCLYQALYSILPSREIYIVGTDSNERREPNDTIWYTTFESLRKNWESSNGYVCIHRSEMEPITRRDFNFYANRQLDLNADPFYDAKDEALK